MCRWGYVLYTMCSCTEKVFRRNECSSYDTHRRTCADMSEFSTSFDLKQVKCDNCLRIKEKSCQLRTYCKILRWRVHKSSAMKSMLAKERRRIENSLRDLGTLTQHAQRNGWWNLQLNNNRSGWTHGCGNVGESQLCAARKFDVKIWIVDFYRNITKFTIWCVSDISHGGDDVWRKFYGSDRSFELCIYRILDTINHKHSLTFEHRSATPLSP